MAAAVAALTAGGATAWAAAPDAHGYWWRAQTGTGPGLPPPPGVPSGGLYVAGGPSGPYAVAAVRVSIPLGQAATSLRLEVAGSQGSPDLVACPTSSPWAPVQAGTWSDAPEADCSSGSVAGRMSGSVVTFAIGALVRSGTLDVVVLPAPASSAVFAESFEPPGPSTVSETALAPPAGATTPPAPSPDAAPAGAGAGATAAPVPPHPGTQSLPVAALTPVAPAGVAPAASPEVLGAQSLATPPASNVASRGSSAPWLLLLAAALIVSYQMAARRAVHAAGDHPLTRGLLATAGAGLGAATRSLAGAEPRDRALGSGSEP